jgi:uncharacterized protein (TIRG00374 family)
MAILKSTRVAKYSKWLYLFLGTAMTLILLGWALRDISLVAVGKIIQGARLEWLLFSLLVYLSSYWVRAWRWGTLLRAYCTPGRFGIRCSATFIGLGANYILPAHAGEALRAAIVNRFSGVPLVVALGSVFAERLLDITIVFLLLAISFWLNPSLIQNEPATLPLIWIGAGLAFICFTLWIAAGFTEKITRLVGMVSRVIGLGRFQARIVASITDLLGGLGVLRQPKRLLAALTQTFLIWGLTGLTYWLGLVAFEIETPGFVGALFVQSCTALAIALPSSPGYIGPFEAAIRFALGLYGVSVNTAIAYAIALRVLMFVTIPLIGLAIAVKLGLSRDRMVLAKPHQ